MAAIDRDVIVVGAGLAGLAAATKLEAQGLDVLVLEAQQRVGGRIHSMRQLGSGEAGGTYIGAGYERVIAAASRHGVPLVDVTPVLQFFREQDLVLGRGSFAGPTGRRTRRTRSRRRTRRSCRGTITAR